MKKIIGFFNVLFHSQGIIENINVQIDVLNKNIQENWKCHSEYNDNFMYLEKFVLSLRNKPLYEMDQVVFFNPNNNAEKPTEKNKLKGKVTGIYAHALFSHDRAIISQVDYEYIYRVKKDGQCCQASYYIRESLIVM